MWLSQTGCDIMSHCTDNAIHSDPISGTAVSSSALCADAD
jgi:hypothetical protein